TNKAMTMAFKYVIAQAFALATAETSDADSSSPEETTRGGGRTQADRSRQPTEEFDPGKRLLETAIAATTADDANSIRLALRAMDPNQDWPAIEDFLATSVFGHGLDQLTRPETGEYWRRLANVLVKADAGGFPPPSTEQMRDAFAWAFK